MSPDRDAVQDALQASYQQITAVAGALGDAELMLPTRCAGWAIGDVLYHQLLDARRALVALATPADAGQRPDVDDVSYWRPFSPRSGAASALSRRPAPPPGLASRPIDSPRQHRRPCQAHPPQAASAQRSWMSRR
jgi:Mycothiol maleylpyruvate isomerase N-terminal domain